MVYRINCGGCMGKIRNRDKTNVLTLISGLIILTVCLLACIIHISDLFYSYKSSVRNDFVVETDEAGEKIAQIITKDKENIVRIADQIGSDAPDGTENTIRKILRENGNDYEELLFVDSSGNVCSVAGGELKYDYGDILSQLEKFDSPSVNISPPLRGEDTEGMAVIFAGISFGHSQAGYVIGVKDYRDIINPRESTFLNKNGAYYLTDESNQVCVTGSEQYGHIADIGDSLFQCLDDYSDGEIESMNRINTLKRNLYKGIDDEERFLSGEGKKICLIGRVVDKENHIFLVVLYDEDDMLASRKPIILRSVIICSVIILLMICLIIYVWGSGQQANMTIEKLAYEDTITHGKNTNYFRDKAMQIINANRETPFIVQRFDICNFRYINEAYGHNRADELLKACITLAERYFDEKELCVRMDSDQFLTLNINDLGVDQKRTSYAEAVDDFARSIGIKYPIRLKFGVYQIRKQDMDIDMIIDHANVARKSMDGDEKKLITYYSDALIQNMRKVDKIESEMHKALETGEFKVYLQPKWDIMNDRLYGAEALVRWIKADGTVVFPGNFIPVFENNGFIEKLDFYMLESICRIMKKRLDKGQRVCPISINQSRLLMHNPDYIKNVTRVLNSNEIPRKYVELELTETVFFDDRSKMIEMMNQLKQLHVKLSMDDFGSGYSSLNLLKEIPFDILKIDREFFSEAITSEASSWILQKIVEMAEGLGIEVICEGVESAEQIAILKSVGCRLVQGYYYSKPIPLDEFMKKYLDSEENMNTEQLVGQENELSSRNGQNIV